MESLLTARQVAEFLNIKASTVYALCVRGELPHVRVTQGVRRALIRFVPSEIEQFVASRCRKAGQGVRSPACRTAGQ